MNEKKNPAEREAFRKRLTEAMVKAGFKAYSPTELMRAFNDRYPTLKVTVHCTRTWQMGAAMPTQERMRALAELLGVNVHWLRFGEEPTLGEPEMEMYANLRTLPESDREMVKKIINVIADHRMSAIIVEPPQETK